MGLEGEREGGVSLCVEQVLNKKHIVIVRFLQLKLLFCFTESKGPINGRLPFVPAT